jgi:homocitrate synthase
MNFKIAKALDELVPTTSNSPACGVGTVTQGLQSYLQAKHEVQDPHTCQMLMDDVRIVVETGVDGVDVVIGTSSFLRKHSYGKDMTYIKNTAIEVIKLCQVQGYRNQIFQ